MAMGQEGDWTDRSEISFQYSLATQCELLVCVCITQQWKIPLGECAVQIGEGPCPKGEIRQQLNVDGELQPFC